MALLKLLLCTLFALTVLAEDALDVEPQEVVEPDYAEDAPESTEIEAYDDSTSEDAIAKIDSNLSQGVAVSLIANRTEHLTFGAPV
jgi:hypothetical protein